MIKLSCGPWLAAHNGWPKSRARSGCVIAARHRALSASLLSELHVDGSGGVVHEGSQKALELLVAERGALLVEHAYIKGAVG